MDRNGQRICAVVPAAGRGSRLGVNTPKILTPLGEGRSVLSVLCRKLLTVADHINLIVSPEGYTPITAAIAREGLANRTTLSIQPEPVGMGDAIFCGYPVWSQAGSILIVWGDQVFVSTGTLRTGCLLHAGEDRTLLIPVAAMAQPYVEYIFASDDRLIAVKQSREGEVCAPGGFGDVGTFVLSVEGLREQWLGYTASAAVGVATGEVNFLPFLPYLSAKHWKVRRFAVADEREALGINTPQDLAFFQSILGNQTGREGETTR